MVNEGSDSRGGGSEVVVIGGGIIGLACAHYLAEAGRRVTIVEKSRVGEACSYRNCGLVCPSHVLPLAMPGAFRSAMSAMFRAGGAFRIRPRLDPALWSWLLKFALKCNHADMLRGGRAIQPLLTTSLDLYRGLLGDGGLACEWQERGLLFVYRTKGEFDAYSQENDLLESEFDEGARRLGPQELRELEPSLRDDLAGAWFFEEDAHLRPEKLIASWRTQLEQRGVRFLEGRTFETFERRGDSATAAIASGEPLRGDTFVVATGAWTPKLAKTLGLRVPIEPGKGYSVIVPNPEHRPRIPMIFPEHRVVITPFDEGIRLGSIMEFSGWDESLRPERLKLLHDGAKPYLRDEIPEPACEEWFGWRPMTYDSVPVIGQCPGFSNVVLATGHNMLGLSTAPATGRLVANLVAGEAPPVDPTPYSPERFR